MPASPIILVTAFEPFGGAPVNGSLEAGRLLAARDPRVRLITIPVVSGEAERVALAALVDTPSPALLLSLGEKRIEPPGLHLEKVALNYDDFRIPDNAGQQPRDTPIRSDGPAAYFATLPVGAIAENLAGKTPLPIALSLSAGAFLCNHLAYRLLDTFSQEGITPPYAFVHVPAWRHEDGQERLASIGETLFALLDAALATVA